MLKCDFQEQNMSAFISPCDVVIGKEYDVPCIFTCQGEGHLLDGCQPAPEIIIPVMFPPHAEQKGFCLNSLPEHYHIDKRFLVPESQMKFDVISSSVVKKIQYIKMKAIKDRFFIEAEARSLQLFNIYYQLQNPDEIAKDRICPHKGTKITNSCGTCPAHGLKWNLKNGTYYYKAPFYFQLTEDGPKYQFKNKMVSLIAHKDIDFQGHIIVTDADGKLFDLPNIRYKTFLKKDETLNYFCT